MTHMTNGSPIYCFLKPFATINGLESINVILTNSPTEESWLNYQLSQKI